MAKALAEQEIAVWDGNYYAWELEQVLGLAPHGAVRAGFLHYNDAADTERLLAARIAKGRLALKASTTRSQARSGRTRRRPISTARKGVTGHRASARRRCKGVLDRGRDVVGSPPSRDIGPS